MRPSEGIQTVNLDLHKIAKVLKLYKCYSYEQHLYLNYPVSKPNLSESADNLCHSERLIVSAIERVKALKQKPTDERIFSQYKRLIAAETGCSDPHPLLRYKSYLENAIEKNIIQRVYGSDSTDISYKIVNSLSQRRRMSSISSDMSSKSYKSSTNDCDFNSDNSSTKRLRLSDERLGETEDSRDCIKTSLNTMSEVSELESLVNDDYCPIDDIDVSSAHVFIHSFKEVSSRVIDLNLDMNSSPTSVCSAPNVTPNHKKNTEAQRPSPSTSSTLSALSEDTDEMLSRIDFQNWLCEEVPRYSPFLAQRGDRVVYLRDAHRIYIQYELEELKALYPKCQTTYSQICDSIKSNDYIVFATITDIKFYQINYIKFSVIRLKSRTKDSSFEFNVLYRPNRGISEFLVLEAFYKSGSAVEWALGSSFMSIWKNSWWIGMIINKSVYNQNYPNSLFKCFEVKWNSGEEGRLSPWDLFAVDPKRMPKKGSGVPAAREDFLANNYRPNPNEWPEVEGLESQLWRCYESKRIYNGLKLIEKHVSQPFVDIFRVCKHREIAYSVDLQVIKNRLKNMFYRRKESVICDIKYLKTNFKLYIKTKDFKSAEDLVDLILSIANDTECCREDQYLDYIQKCKHLTEPVPQTNGESAHRLVGHISTSRTSDLKKSSKSSNNGFDSKSSTKKKTRKPSNSSSNQSTEPEVKTTESKQWKVDSQKFIDNLLKKDESMPYRQPVDPVLFPTYRTVIENPIDLSEIQRILTNDQYLNPIEMRKDFRLMYENARVFTKDPKSKMRLINKEMKNWSEDRLREIIVDWERVYAYEQKTQKGFKVREPTSRNQLWGYGAQQYY